MKEILIISYFYPPCTLTAAQRPAGWVKYLHEYGFRPIVITRNWDLKITKPEDQLRDAGKEVVIDNSEKFEIHYLPYKASLRDRIFNSSNPILKKGSKILTFINSIGENYFNHFIPFSNFYDYASKLIEERKINLLIITANPFIQFRFGYLLNKKYGISWVADYRDDWTTSEIIKPTSLVEKILFSFQQTSEKKWVKTASFITSVSEVYTKRISKFVGVRGETILNGFDELYQVSIPTQSDKFTITYNGTLYPSQDVEGFIKVIIQCISFFKNTIFIYVQFPGVAYDPVQAKRVTNLIVGYENHFLLTDRIPKKEVIELQRNSDLLLMLTHIGTKGVPSSKLYEYLAIQKPILCYPSDFDIVEKTISAVGNGIIVNDLNQLFAELKIMINAKILKEELFTNIELNKLMCFSRKKQVRVLANSLTHI
jgi:glycosyltransferase involved in cell wall biosynthesis